MPHDTSPERADRRRLGVMVHEIVVDAADGRRTTVALDDPRLGAGFHAIQDSPGGAYRWTNGDARLDPAQWAGHDGTVTIYVKFAVASTSAWMGPVEDARAA